MRKKKVFRNESLNRLCLLERAVWLVPIGIFLYNVWIDREEIMQVLKADSSFAVIVGLICCFGVITIFYSLIPFAILKVVFGKMKKQVMRNNSFIPIEDFDYYRDKLSGLSPAMISIISDLGIEQRKDVAASILKYQEMGILKVDGNHYEAGDYRNANLRQSDKYLIEGLVNRTFSMENDRKWKQLVEQEAVEEGYLWNRFSPQYKKSKQKKNGLGCGGGCLMSIITLILAIVIVFHVNDKMGQMEHLLQVDETQMTFEEQLENFKQCLEYYPVLAEMVLGVVLFLMALISPVLMLVGAIATAAKAKLLVRTDAGNEMAECIYGMKNFIHDFSNLKEADKEQVVLWDDYLIYAVVLEENQQIVDDIMKRRNERWK